MARRPKDLERDPLVVLVGEAPSGDMDTWFAGLVRDDPTVLPVTAAESVVDTRTESE